MILATVIDMATSKIVQKHKEYLFPAVAMYYQEPFALVRGEGIVRLGRRRAIAISTRSAAC